MAGSYYDALVVLDGWLLARTEARVFALAAIGAAR
jgi:hypothetical protein